MRRVAGAFVLLVLLASCSQRDEPRTETALPTLAPGALVPGSPRALQRTIASLRGRPVVVNYWATWCIPCADELPRFVEAADRYEGRVTFLGVDVEDDRRAARRFVREYGIPYASLEDPKKLIFRDQRLLGLPATHFYRSDGELAFAHNGEILADELEKKIDELIRTSEPVGSPVP
jgi:thiol-disulfide isomerase/thioredoxin